MTVKGLNENRWQKQNLYGKMIQKQIFFCKKKKKTPREIVKTEDEQKIFGFNVFKMQ